MEKRRRARINHCLNELKSLILEAMKKDPARHTKLEKADILEMTVKHLQSVQRQQLNLAIQTDPSVIHKFKTGFVECAEEVNRYISQLDGVDNTVRQRLNNHLNNCATNLDQIGSMTNFNNGYHGNTTSIFGAPSTATITQPPTGLFPNYSKHDNNGIIPTTPLHMNGVQLIPSRLPSGEFALIVPNTNNTTTITDVWPTTNIPSLPLPIETTQQRVSAFAKPQTLTHQPHQPQIATNSKYILTKKSTTKTIVLQQNTSSPPLSPISSVSSHGDDSSMLQTSSELSTSRSTTPPQDVSLNVQHNFSGVFTPPSSADTSLTSNNSSIHLQQQQVTSTSENENNQSLKRLHSDTTTDSGESSDEQQQQQNSNVKKFATCKTNDENSPCWRPW